MFCICAQSFLCNRCDLKPASNLSAACAPCFVVQVDAQESVIDGIKEVFKMHGATAMASSDLGFVPVDFPGDAVSLLAPCGDLWGLRYDLRFPFASWLAHQAAIGNSKSAHLFYARYSCSSSMFAMHNTFALDPHLLCTVLLLFIHTPQHVCILLAADKSHC